MSSRRTFSVLGRRLCAALAVCSAVLHGAMIGHADNPATVALIVAMMVGCIACGVHLWKMGSPRTWSLVAVMNLAMVAAHWSAPAHHHGAAMTSASMASAPVPGLMELATAVALTEVLLATVALCFSTRGRTLAGGSHDSSHVHPQHRAELVGEPR